MVNLLNRVAFKTRWHSDKFINTSRKLNVFLSAPVRHHRPLRFTLEALTNLVIHHHQVIRWYATCAKNLISQINFCRALPDFILGFLLFIRLLYLHILKQTMPIFIWVIRLSFIFLIQSWYRQRYNVFIFMILVIDLSDWELLGWVFDATCEVVLSGVDNCTGFEHRRL